MGMSERDVQSFVYFLSLHCKLAVLGMTVRSAAGRGRVVEAQPRRASAGASTTRRALVPGCRCCLTQICAGAAAQPGRDGRK